MRFDATGFGTSGSGPGSAPEASEPPLYDPYVGHEAPRTDTRGPDEVAVSVTSATWSLVLGLCSLLLAPITAPIAILLGLLGLRRARRLAADGWDAASPRRRARLGIGIACASLVMQIGLVGFGVHRYRDEVRRAQAAIPAPPPRVVIRPTDPDAPIPMTTVEVDIGRIHVVTLGARDGALERALRRESDAARADGEEMLVVVIQTDCQPCDGLQESLRDPLMQSTLERHRLVFVYQDVFAREIVGLGMDARHIAGFYLLERDLTVRDAIHGGEWGEDIAVNIAPVLGSFLRGELSRRRYDWRAASAFPEDIEPPVRTPHPYLPPSRPGASPPPPNGVWL